MTDARALRERVARAMSADDNDGNAAVFDLMNNGYRDEYRMRAKVAIDLVLEEAARVVRRMPSPSSEWMADELLRALGGPANQVPEDIRALKSKTGSAT